MGYESIFFTSPSRLGVIKKPKSLNPIEKAKKNPKSLRMAINAKCYNCSGFTKKDVACCDMTDCELYNLRPWQRPHIKIQVDGVGVLLSEKSAMGKNNLPDNKIPRNKLNSEGRLLPPYAKLQANPKSLRAAINAYCFWCSCEQYKEVRLCPAGDCPLHHHRPWQSRLWLNSSKLKDIESDQKLHLTI